jgi:hypothetical protein
MPPSAGSAVQAPVSFGSPHTPTYIRKHSHMKGATTMRKAQRTTIDELSAVGQELSEEHVRLASGGMRCASYRAASCTFNNDIDAYRVD